MAGIGDFLAQILSGAQTMYAGLPDAKQTQIANYLGLPPPAPAPTEPVSQPQGGGGGGNGMGFRLNPFEQNALGAVMAALSHPGTSDIASQLGMTILGGAQDRRQQNIQTRDQGIAALQQQALQLAQSGAAPDAVVGALTGQAEMLPGMNGPVGQGMLGDLSGYVNSLYQNGPVSGLAPADYRAQFDTTTSGNGVLDQQDRAIVGQTVIGALQKGVPFVQIRQQVEQTMIAAGGTEADVAAAVQAAEQMYEQATGVSLEQLRATGDTLRSAVAQGTSGDFADQLRNLGYGSLAESFSAATPDFNPAGVQGFLGQIASQPGALSHVYGAANAFGTQGDQGAGAMDYAKVLDRLIQMFPKV